MDAADGQAQYLHLQFWVRVDLGSRGALIRDSACDSPQFPPHPPPHRLAGFLRARNNLPPAKLSSSPGIQSAAGGICSSLRFWVPQFPDAGRSLWGDSQSACPAPGSPHTVRFLPPSRGVLALSHRSGQPPKGEGNTSGGHREALCTPTGWALCLSSRANMGLICKLAWKKEQATFVGAHSTGLTLALSPLAAAAAPASTKGSKSLYLAQWTHLGIVQRKLVLRALEDSFTVKGEGTGSQSWRGNPGPPSPPQPEHPLCHQMGSQAASPERASRGLRVPTSLGPREEPCSCPGAEGSGPGRGRGSCLRQHLANRWQLATLPPGRQLGWERNRLPSHPVPQVDAHWLGWKLTGEGEMG